VAVSYYSPSYQSDPTLRTTIFDEKGFRVMEVPHIFEKLEFSANENDIVLSVLNVVSVDNPAGMRIRC